jgi:hypothetical protein
MKFTPENITSLEPHQIFVFGSNFAGLHGAGAAALAHKKFGAVWGKGVGLYGQSYALPTKDHQIITLALTDIEYQIDLFLGTVNCFPQLEFLVTKIGCGLAGYDSQDIATLFKGRDIPSNVILPESFSKIIYEN